MRGKAVITLCPRGRQQWCPASWQQTLPGPTPHSMPQGHVPMSLTSAAISPLSGTPQSIVVCIQAPAWTSITLHCSVIFFCNGDLCGKIKFTNLLSPQLFIFHELFTLSETRGTLSCCSGLDAIQTGDNLCNRLAFYTKC